MDPLHDDLPGNKQAKQQNQSRAFVGERPLGLGPSAKLSVDALNGIGRA